MLSKLDKSDGLEKRDVSQKINKRKIFLVFSVVFSLFMTIPNI